MPLVVEDGRCPKFANSYISLEDADLYLAGRGLWPETPVLECAPEEDPAKKPDKGENEPDNEISPLSEEEIIPLYKPDPQIVKNKEAALIRAFDFLNTLKWKGEKPCWERTAAWPRENVPIPGNEQDEFIDPDLIPQAVIQAQCELAGLIYNGYEPFAPVEHGGKAKSVSSSRTETVDVLSESESHSVTYADNAPTETWLPSVYPLIAPFLEEVPGQSKSGFTVHNISKS